MTVRQSGTQCSGAQLPDKPHSRPCNPRSRRLGDRVRWHEEQESSKRIPTRSVASVPSERIFRSRETVEAWLESSPTSVLDDLDDESACSPSSFESFNSSSGASVNDHLSYTTRFPSPTVKSKLPGHARSRTISPPRCTANKNSVDLSRIDPAYYSSGSFLLLAFKDAQYRSSSSPPAFQYTSGAFGDDHVQSLNLEEFGSSRSEFSLTSEWQNMLAAGNAAGMSARDSPGNNSEFEVPGQVLNISGLDLNSGVSKLPANPELVTAPHHRTRSLELPRMHGCSASGELRELKDILVDDSNYTCASAKLEQNPTDSGTIHEQSHLRRLSRRNSISFTGNMREAFEVLKSAKQYCRWGGSRIREANQSIRKEKSNSGRIISEKNLLLV